MERRESPVEGEEVLTEEEALEESVYLGLRANDGLNPQEVASITDEIAINELIDCGFLESRNSRLHVPEDKWLLLDEIVLKILSKPPPRLS